MRQRIAPAGLAVALFLHAMPALGQSEMPAWDGLELGRTEYMAGCAQCHGLTGRGDGVIADYLTVPPPDLTRIAAENDGQFPAGRIFAIIAEGGAVAAHGSPEMPAWGDRYSVDAYFALGWPHDAAAREAFIRARILALVEYIASIQGE